MNDAINRGFLLLGCRKYNFFFSAKTFIIIHIVNSIKIEAVSEDDLLYVLGRKCHLRYSHWDFVSEDTKESITNI